jgi:hypothetical protein
MSPGRYWFEIAWRCTLFMVWCGVFWSLGWWFLISHIELLGFSVFHIGIMMFVTSYPMFSVMEKRPPRPGAQNAENFITEPSGS